MAARSRYGSEAPPLLGYEVRIPPGAWMSVSVVSVVCCQVEVSVTSRAVVQSPTECGTSECGLEISTMRRLRPTRAVIYIYNGKPLLLSFSQWGNTSLRETAASMGTLTIPGSAVVE